MSNDIVVLRKQSGSFRAGGPNGGHNGARRHTLQNGADVTMVINHFDFLKFLQELYQLPLIDLQFLMKWFSKLLKIIKALCKLLVRQVFFDVCLSLNTRDVIR